MDMFKQLATFAWDKPRLRSVSNTLSQLAINQLASTTQPRPRPFSLWSEHSVSSPAAPAPVSEYTSWPSLTNKRFFSRHLPPASQAYVAALPTLPGAGSAIDPVTSLFMRRGHAMAESRSSLLFMFFAQWFTDSILRSDPSDTRKNTSNHEIDLCQIYGLREEQARLLRTLRGGKLRSQIIRGRHGEYPDYLCEQEGPRKGRVKPQYEALVSEDDLQKLRDDVRKIPGLSDAERDARCLKFYATGLERGNSSIGYVAISTLFLREHNRICEALGARNPRWDDERLFQTARMINTIILMKMIVEEYINHVMGFRCFRLDPSFAERQPWYRPNWMTLEFDLLYRWHGLVPDQLRVGQRLYPHPAYRYNNDLLESVDLGDLITATSTQPAGRAGLYNTPSFLGEAQRAALRMGRNARLQPYNAYRQHFGLPPLKSYADLTKDESIQKELERLYGGIENLELVVGLFAEEPEDGYLFGGLMHRMVAYDAFTQIFTNPLLSCHVFNADTLTAWGVQEIEQTSSLERLVRRNVPGGCIASFDAQPRQVSMSVERLAAE